jgi:DNA-binding NarL/FixJ family response regulator
VSVAAPYPAPVAEPVRVVLVDDVPDVRQLVRTALRFRGGFEVVGEAPDGRRAVELARTLAPDLVVLDLGLPDLAGREVLVQIREHSPSTKVVVFSGAEVPDRAWVRDNVEGYVLKDADLDYLVDLLESVGQVRQGQAELELPADLASVRRARWFTRDRLEAWDGGMAVSDTLVVVSELVANALTHTGSGCRLRLSFGVSAVRVEVVDDGSGTPEPRPPSATREGGRGLHLIDALTTAWGIEMVPDGGKVVWAELPRRG